MAELMTKPEMSGKDGKWYFNFGKVTYGPYDFLTTAILAQENLKTQLVEMGSEAARLHTEGRS